MNSKQRIVIGLGLAAGLVVGALSGFRWWRSAVLQRTGTTALASAKASLEQGKPAGALALLDQAQPTADGMEEWKRTEVAAASEALKMDRLMAIYDREPPRILADETASLRVYRSFAAKGNEEAAAAIAAYWEAKSSRPAAWTLNSADALMGKGEGAKARKLLESSQGWAGPDELQRQMRLALLQAPEDLGAAWEKLERAMELDPKNADIRSFRGQVLESTGRVGEARVEYVAALLAEPDSVLRRDQLAAFYLRQGDFDHAVTTWLDPARSGPSGVMEVKGRFWATVVSPGLAKKFPFSPDAGPWRKVLDAMELAPPGRWMAPVMGSPGPALTEHGELWWLALLDVLQAGDETEAANLLPAIPAKARAMAPDLVSALRTVLAVRAKRPVESILRPDAGKGGSRASFFIRLEAFTRAARSGTDLADGAALQAECRHPAALAYVLAAAGWREASLRLFRWESAPDLPEAMRYTAALCLKLNRGPEPAAMLLKGSESALLRGLAGECSIAAGQVAAGLKELEAASRDDSAAGRRAGWLLSLARLEQRDFPAAARALMETPRLASAPEGLEIAAKLALAQNQPDKATDIYRQAAALGSVEARTWLLRESVKAGDPVAAREASMKLRELVPDEMQARANQLDLPVKTAP